MSLGNPFIKRILGKKVGRVKEEITGGRPEGLTIAVPLELPQKTRTLSTFRIGSWEQIRYRM